MSGKTLDLLSKINKSGLLSSVRDFHTLNSLAFKSCNNFLMTGCPAYYDIDHIGKQTEFPEKINKVAFSLGVSFIESPSMEKQMRAQIIRLKEYFKDCEFEVVFHHGLNPESFLKTHGAKKRHNLRHNEFASWLQEHGIGFVDISGSAENLINYYSAVDLHIGYRVHAHIFMNSISKLSILISEDGRGKATEKVIGGLLVDGYLKYKSNLLAKVLNKLVSGYDRYSANSNAAEDVIKNIEYQCLTRGHGVSVSRSLIDSNYKIMSKYIEMLP